ncbi:MAG: histidinol-phosphatase [Caulobacteraceae bacterium]|nr:histidinol-phosphatase [Caulobacteraceae bacterium]
MPTHDTTRLIAFADTLADAARETILPYFRAKHSVANKLDDGRFDPVTDADQAAERAMLAQIEREFPDHGVLGEEYGERAGKSGYQWILDPIDGTRAFISGLPTWGVLIGLYYEGRPLIGVMDQPFTQERYRGWMDGANATTRAGTHPIRARSCGSLSNATLSTTSPDLFEDDEARAWSNVRREAKLARYGLDCYAYAMIAAGHMDGVLESNLKPFDIAALIPIITGAGGGVCAWDGGDASQGGRVLAFGDTRVRDEALKLLSPSR